MVNALRWSLLILAGLAVLLTLAVSLLESQWARRQLEEGFSQRLDGREVQIGSLGFAWGWPPGIHLDQVSVANATWADEEQMLRLAVLDLTLDASELLKGNLSLTLLGLEQPVIHLVRREDGSVNWAPLKSPDPNEKGMGIDPQVIKMTDGQLSFRDAKLGADVSVSFETTRDDVGERHLTIQGQGELLGKPLQFSAKGGPPSQALAQGSPYAANLQGSLGPIQLSFVGQAQELLQLESLQGELSLAAPDSMRVAGPLGMADLQVPAFAASAKVSHQDQRWSLEDIELQSGESQLYGALTYVRGQTPRLDLQIQADRLDLNHWGVMALVADGDAETDSSASPQQRLVQSLEPLRRYQGKIDLRIGRLDYGDASLSELEIHGQLADGQLEIERLHAVQDDATLSAQASLSFASSTATGRIDVELDQVDLGRALAPLGYPQLGTLDGELHVRLDENALRIDDSPLSYHAPAQRLHVQLRAATAESGGLHLQGTGSRNDVPFQFDLSVLPPADLLAAQPFGVAGSVSAGDTTLSVDGQVIQPLQLASLDLDFAIDGPSPSRLEGLTGLSLPRLPAYRAQGRLNWDAPLLRLQNVQGHFGDSDVSGDVRLRLGDRPMLWATLYSQTLNITDLSPAQDGAARPARAEVFSANPWQLAWLRTFDAELDYQANNVNTRTLPLGSVDLELSLANGRIEVQPLQIGLGGGEVSGRLNLDARRSPLNAQLELAATRVQLKPLLRHGDLPNVAEDSAGVIGGQLGVRASGDSMDALMADLDGKLELAMSGGRLDMLTVELLGLDGGERLVSTLTEADTVPMDCAYARFVAEAGRAQLEQFFVATADSNFTGGGTVNLATERLDLAFEAHPKDVSILSSASPVHLQGTLSNPAVSAVSDELLARAVASVIGVVVAPPLAILPWIEPGLGEGSGMGCRKVLQAEQRMGTDER
ncbi:AsmA family protein [Pseudomonas borbori]